jgi:glutamate formiminotransferase/formiminotetrahydrofolate cyclodeaminase
VASLIECVPNFSEGRALEKIGRITDALASDPKVSILGCEPGAGANRTVVTLVGPSSAVVDAAFRGIEAAADCIDMRQHRGAHQRIGATDVCPFVPLENTNMEDCVSLARELGARVGDELGIAVFLYGEAATRKERRTLAGIRRGEYETLVSKLRTAGGAPDFGPTELHPTAGATAIGARDFLIAWNVNLESADATLAERIATVLRESGAPERDQNGHAKRDSNGRPIRVPGRFKQLQGRGWFIAEYGCAQISFNLLDYRTSGLNDVFQACCAEAENLGTRVTGSELIGLAPLEALLRAGMAFLQQPANDGMLLEAAVEGLGLSSLRRFNRHERIIEYALKPAL